MAWRITDEIDHGEIDNRTKGIVTGRLWLGGRTEPVRLDLAGNAWRDVAGCLLRFRNPHCRPVHGESIASPQQGVCGDLTASRKVKLPTIPMEELNDHDLDEALPSRWTNVLYLEWFSSQNGRVVIDGVDFEITISEPTWRLTPEDEEAQRARKSEAMDQFMDRMTKDLVSQKFADISLESDEMSENAQMIRPWLAADSPGAEPSSHELPPRQSGARLRPSDPDENASGGVQS